MIYILIIIIPISSREIKRITLCCFTYPQIILLVKRVTLTIFFCLIIILITVGSQLIQSFISLSHTDFPSVHI